MYDHLGLEGFLQMLNLGRSRTQPRSNRSMSFGGGIFFISIIHFNVLLLKNYLPIVLFSLAKNMSPKTYLVKISKQSFAYGETWFFLVMCCLFLTSSLEIYIIYVWCLESRSYLQAWTIQTQRRRATL